MYLSVIDQTNILTDSAFYHGSEVLTNQSCTFNQKLFVFSLQLYDSVPLVRHLPLPFNKAFKNMEVKLEPQLMHEVRLLTECLIIGLSCLFQTFLSISTRFVNEHKESRIPGEPRDFVDCYLDELDKVWKHNWLSGLNITSNCYCIFFSFPEKRWFIFFRGPTQEDQLWSVSWWDRHCVQHPPDWVSVPHKLSSYTRYASAWKTYFTVIKYFNNLLFSLKFQH